MNVVGDYQRGRCFPGQLPQGAAHQFLIIIPVVLHFQIKIISEYGAILVYVFSGFVQIVI